MVNRFLGQLEIEYFIAYGTLLGYHRGEGIVLGDDDVDFGTFVSNHQTILDNGSLLPPGYKLWDSSHRHNGPKLYVQGPHGWEADIYMFVEDGRELTSTAVEYYRRHMEPFSRDLINPLQKVRFLEQDTWVPNKIEGWLVHCYGYLGRDAVFDKNEGIWRQKH